MSIETEELRRAAALAYDGELAPRLVAKGSGELAAEIEALARRHDIPVIQDPRLSALLSAVPLGQEVPPQLYVAVATVLAYVFGVSGRTPRSEDEPCQVLPPGE
ncbi:MAG: EscU/YscU/HrcU family type III secretion system export apparatus switch protein [Halieaceae bacterium]